MLKIEADDHLCRLQTRVRMEPSRSLQVENGKGPAPKPSRYLVVKNRISDFEARGS